MLVFAGCFDFFLFVFFIVLSILIFFCIASNLLLDDDRYVLGLFKFCLWWQRLLLLSFCSGGSDRPSRLSLLVADIMLPRRVWLFFLLFDDLLHLVSSHDLSFFHRYDLDFFVVLGADHALRRLRMFYVGSTVNRGLFLCSSTSRFFKLSKVKLVILLLNLRFYFFGLFIFGLLFWGIFLLLLWLILMILQCLFWLTFCNALDFFYR